MQKFLPTLVAASLVASAAAFAQTTPATPPASSAPSTAVEKSTTPPAPTLILTNETAKAWVDKAVYSSDGKNIGTIVGFERDASGKVTQMQIDIGGFLGLGQTRVSLLPAEFQLVTDRAVLSLTAEQAKTLPKVQQ